MKDSTDGAINPKVTESGRIRFVDGLRGLCVIFMVLNHTARWWMDGAMGWSRYYFIYYTLSLGVPVWLFLVGFSMSMSFTRTALLRPFELRSKAFRYARRGLVIVLEGYALSIIVFPEDPWYGTTALHTIGLGMIASIPLLFLLQTNIGRIVTLALAPLFYGLFILYYGDVEIWVANHPILSPSVFFDFAPWPWMAAVFLGLFPGWLWMQGQRANLFRYSHAIKLITVVGIAMVVIFAALQWINDKTLIVDFRSDLLLNNHWIPKPITTTLMYGTLFLIFSLLYWLLEIHRIGMDWLIILGKTTLFIFFIHHLIGLMVIKRWLGMTVNNWFYFTSANVFFIFFLIWLGRCWLFAKSHFFYRENHPGRLA